MLAIASYTRAQGDIQNRKENGEKDNRPKDITAPEPKPMPPQILSGRALDVLKCNGVRSLDVLEIVAIERIFGRKRTAMDTESILGGSGAEIGGLLGQVLCLAHCP